jgi:DNA mismatch repair protein MutS2
MMFAQRRWGLDRLGRTRGAEAEPDEPAPLGRAPVPMRLPPIASQAPSATPLPDLLNPIPTQTLDAARLVRVLNFAFVSGDDGGVLASALDDAPIAHSDFDPECFFHELYLEDLMRSCMQIRVGGKPVRPNVRYLLRLLSQPPAELEAITQRRAIFAELTQDAGVRRAVELLYGQLRELRRLFEGEDRLGIHGEQAKRRIDMLRALRESFARMSAPEFENSPSALTRLQAFAAHVQTSEGHARLDELLRYENERAYADLTLQLAADGSVRGLSLVRVREDVKNRYHVSLARRIWSRLSLLMRGYRVSDAEIVDRWLDHVFDGVSGFVPALLQLLGDLELYLAGLALYDACRERGLPTSFPEFAAQGERCEVEQLYNPLLFAQSIVPVPCSVELACGGVTTLITGPNSGGKTRLLQAVGILQLCAHAGMLVPAARARLPFTSGIFASLTQPSGAEQSEGRLGTELMRIRMLFERANTGYLVLVDELCSGTSPSEGEELFRLVLELLAELGPVSLVSTHFLKLAASLMQEQTLPLNFVQVELDREQRPTYRFTPGVAATSLAKQTAARLGVTREELRALLAQKGVRAHSPAPRHAVRQQT